MNREDLLKLVKLARENGLPHFTICVGMYIAAHVSSDETILKEFGSLACSKLQELHHSLNS